jgi:autotransporter-associated beta strand protein
MKAHSHSAEATQRIAAVLFLTGTFFTAQAADIFRAANSTTLDVSGAFTNAAGTAIIPGTGDVAVWDKTLTSAQAGAALAADGSWQGVSVGSSLNRDITIATNGVTQSKLTLGTAGIDLTGARYNIGIVPDVALGAAQTWLLGTNNVVIRGTMSGTNTLTLSGSGGALQIGNGGTTGTLGSGEVINNAILNFNRSDAITVTNKISGSGSLTKVSGGGVLTLSGDNTYSGNTLIGSGSGNGISVSSDANLGTGTNITISQNAKLTVTADITTDKSITFASGINGQINIATNVTLTLNSGLQGPSTGFEKNGAGTLTLNGTNGCTATPTFMVSSGKLNLNSSNALAGTVLKFNGSSSVLDNTTGGALAPAGLRGFALTTGFTFLGTDDLDLSGATNTFHQTADSIRTINVSAKTLTLGGITTNGVGGANGADGGLTKSGTGTLVLTGESTYSGDTTVSAGTLVLSNALSLQNSTLNCTASGAAGFGAGTAAFTLGGLAGSQDLALTNMSGTAISLTVGNNNNNSTYGGILSEGGSLIKIGTGTLTITNTGNSYSGGTVVNAGTLSTDGKNNPLGTGTVTLNDGTYLSLAAGAISNAVVIPAGQNAAINGNADLNGPLSGSGSLTHGTSGEFKLTLAGDNSGFSGSITNMATLSVKHKNALGTGTLYMQDGAGVNSSLAANMELLGYNALTNNIVLLNTARIGATSSAGDFELKGVVSGGGGLILNHPDVMLTLSGANTYSGNTTISNGGLIINGILQSGLITAASGTTLSGTGTVQAVTMNGGSVLELGGSTPVQMNFQGDLTLAAGSTNVMKVSGTNSYDVLMGAGTNALVLNGTILLDFIGNLTVDAGNQFNVLQMYQNWSSVTLGAELSFATVGLPGALALDTSSTATNGIVTIVSSGAVPITLPESYPISMTYHGPTPGTNTIYDELVKYQNVEIMGAVRDGYWDATRAAYPGKIILKQDAWGGNLSIGKSLAWPGHWLLKTGTKLAADCSATSTVLSVQNYSLLAANQAEVDKILLNNSCYLLMYGLDGNGQPDWSRAEHLIITAVNTNNGTITVERGQEGSQALAFTNGQAVIARHMMFWQETPGGQWQLNFSLQCPRGGPLNLTAAEWFARQIKKIIDESGADGVEFDVARWQWGNLRSNIMDCNNDLVTDYGYIDGVQSFGLGGQVFVKELRRLLGPGKIIQMDSGGAVGQQRGWQYVNGCQMESFPNANDFDTFSEAFLHLRQYRDNIETLPNFSYSYVKTPNTTFENLYDNGASIDWHFRTGFAAGLLTGMPSPFSSLADTNFDPGEFDPDATNTVVESAGGSFFKWDEYVGGDLNNWQWLGRPLGTATQILDNLSSTNLLAPAVWKWTTDTNFSVTCLTNSGEYSTVISTLAPVSNIPPSKLAGIIYYSGTKVPKILTFGNRLEIASGTPVLPTNQEYTIEFEACGNDSWNYAGQTFDKVPRMLSLLTPQDGDQLTVLVSSNWASYRLSFFSTVTNVPLVFGASEQIGDVKIRNVKLYQGGGECWMREFEHGRVYLNMTKSPWAVDVGTGVVQRLIGTQDTNANSGVVENGALTVPSRDAVFLRTWTVDAWRSAYFTAD